MRHCNPHVPVRSQASLVPTKRRGLNDSPQGKLYKSLDIVHREGQAGGFMASHHIEERVDLGLDYRAFDA